MITCCYASPINSVKSKSDLTNIKSTTESKIDLTAIKSTIESKSDLTTTKSTTVSTTVSANELTTKLTNGLTAIKTSAINKPSLLNRTRVASINLTTPNKADTLYQVANNLLQKEKNWLQTEKWLIDNVYRLRNELSDIKRELGDQKRLNLFLSQKASTPNVQSSTQLHFITANEQTKSANFFQDLSALRADHTVIAQQQHQLVESTKDNQQQMHIQTDLLKQLTTMVKEQFKSVASISQAMISLQQINDSSMNGNTNQLISKLMYDLSALSTTSSAATEQLNKETDKKQASTKQQPISPKLLQFLKTESQFEGRAEQKIGQLNEEMHGLHKMTMNLSKDLADLQKKVIKINKN